MGARRTRSCRTTEPSASTRCGGRRSDWNRIRRRAKRDRHPRSFGAVVQADDPLRRNLDHHRVQVAYRLLETSSLLIGIVIAPGQAPGDSVRFRVCSRVLTCSSKSDFGGFKSGMRSLTSDTISAMSAAPAPISERRSSESRART